MIALTAVLLATARSYDLAAVTRIYYPPNDRRISHLGLYLVSLSGAYRRIDRGSLTNEPVWLDHDHVAWVEGTKSGDELWQVELPSLRAHRLRKASHSKANVTFQVSGMRFTEQGGEIRLEAPDVKEETNENVGFVEESGKFTIRLKDRTYPIVNGKQTWLISYTGEGKSQFDLSEVSERPPVYWSQVQVKGNRFVRLAYPITAHDGVEVLVRIDSQGKASVIPIDAAEIDFETKRSRFVAISGRRVDPHGYIGVWASDVYVGDLPSGKFRRVPLPKSYTIRAVLRP